MKLFKVLFIIILCVIPCKASSRLYIYNIIPSSNWSLLTYNLQNEFDNIYLKKADLYNPTFTGTLNASNISTSSMTVNSLTVNGNISSLNVTQLNVSSITATGSITANEITSTYGFIHDRGDPSTWDLTQAGMTMDGAWHDWDLSSIIPAGSKTVMLYVEMYDTDVGDYLIFRKNGNINEYNISKFYIHGSSVEGVLTEGNCIVSCDTDRIIEYKTNSNIQSILITVIAWSK